MNQCRNSLRIPVLVLLLLLPFSAISEGATGTLDLSDAERAWLESHPRVGIGVMDAWPPIQYTDAEGAPAGIGSEPGGAIPSH